MKNIENTENTAGPLAGWTRLTNAPFTTTLHFNTAKPSNPLTPISMEIADEGHLANIATWTISRVTYMSVLLAV